MSKLSIKIGEVDKNLQVFSLYELDKILRDFDEDSATNFSVDDVLVWLNEEKTRCLTLVLLDKNGVSIQLIEENKETSNPVFLVKNLRFDETVLLVNTILRRNKIKKLNYG